MLLSYILSVTKCRYEAIVVKFRVNLSDVDCNCSYLIDKQAAASSAASPSEVCMFAVVVDV